MMTAEQADLLEVLAELRRQYPAWRLGQMIANVAGWADQEIWDIQDDILLEAARSHIQALAKREQEVCV
ncbi:MAG: hypothetical protein NTY19_46935 [Planctomycetota bacterium]|nr:hypothetical protein [Planctomycetota bacterium]